MNILISACLLGIHCRYDGTVSEISESVKLLMKRHNLIPFCPEIYGGLVTPRDPAEITGGRVVTCNGADVTSQYMKGAGEALKTAKLFGCTCAVLKERSPSCGFGKIYDGSFKHVQTDGNGVTADLLGANGIKIYGESRISELLQDSKTENYMKFNSLIPELSVTDIEKTRKFYCGVLGFKIEYERPEKKFIFVSYEGNQIMLEEINGCWNTGRLEYPFGRGINFEIGVSDVEAIYNRVIDAGIKIFADLKASSYRCGTECIIQKEFLVQDPDGYLLRFAQ